MLTLDDVIEFIHNPLAYEQRLVSIINDKGEQIPLSHYGDMYNYVNSTIKIEGMEKFNSEIYDKCNEYKLKYKHNGAVTCHVFLSQENSPSFGEHTDPDDVIIYCCEGIKTMKIDNQYTVIKQHQDFFIPANTPHQALNEYFALTLSFGLEKFLIDKAKYYELDVISKNN
jgi:mannose-6-phosphate isomerase-like protein (cupin superfamily)